MNDKVVLHEWVGIEIDCCGQTEDLGYALFVSRAIKSVK